MSRDFKNDGVTTHYIIIDRKTGLQVGKPMASLRTARNRVDKLDLAYGGYRYSIRPTNLTSR